MRLCHLVITLLCCVNGVFFTYAQSPQGLPLVRNYEPREYGSHRQNWAIAQDPSGIMYFANGKGLLSFNGEDWKLALIPNRGHVRSLAVDVDGTVYVGAQNDFGRLEADENGDLQFRSFLHLVPGEDRSFGRIRKTIIDGDKVYFQSDYRVFRVSGDSLDLWRSDGSHRRLFAINDSLYLGDFRQGLLKLSPNDEFEAVPGGSFFKSMRISTMIPYDQYVLIGTRKNGLFLYDGQTSHSFATEADDYFKQYQLSDGLVTRKNKLIFRMNASGGIVVLSPAGKLECVIRQENGLASSNVLSIFEDGQNSLWAGLQEGLARIELSSPYTLYDERLGLNGSVQSMIIHQDRLYASTSEGLAVRKKDGLNWRFEAVAGTLNYGWVLASWRDQLLMGSSFGAYSIIEDRLTYTFEDNNLVSAIAVSKFDESIVYMATDNGFAEYQWSQGGWELNGRIDGLTGSVRAIIESGGGAFWLKTRSNGIFKITLPIVNGVRDYSHPGIEHYLEAQGVPVGENSLFMVDKTLYVRSENDSLYQYHEKDDRFYLEDQMASLFGINEGYVLPKQAASDGVVWLDRYYKNRQYLVRAEKTLTGQYSMQEYPVSALVANYRDPYGNEVFLEGNDFTWFGSMKGILQYNSKDLTTFEKPFEVILTKVMARGSVIHSNYWGESTREIPYAQNDLLFLFTCPIYKDGVHRAYQYFLEGFDQGWSAWSTASRKEYTSLPIGDYTFHVRAKNDYGVLSNVYAFEFRINPPWYQSVAAYLTYALFAGGLVWLIVYIRSKKYERENLRLEKVIQDRTLEIKTQADKITELYEVKSQFLANISHELRTPLTLILGPVESLLQTRKGEERRELLWIKRNGQRLLKLINQLLDQSKVEAGELKLNVSYENIIPFARGVLMSFESLAKQENVALDFHTHKEDLYLYFEMEKVEQVLINLLSNAIKFTPPGGKVNFEINAGDRYASIKVRDTGIGIDPQHLPHIFERFFQIEDPTTKKYQGTGIGLSLSKDLVELHTGTLTVESEPGKGSAFEILLPLGKDHFKEDQVVESAPALGPGLVDTLENGREVEAPRDEVQTGANLPLLLIVDDNQDMREFIRHQLKTNYTILQAADGLQGWEAALEHLPDLIISDVMMPGMSGFDLCQKLKSDIRTDHIPVILLTAKAGQDQKIKGLKLQADDYLGKPFEAQELVIRVRNLVQGRRHLQKRFAEKIVFKPSEIAATPQEEVFLEKLIDTVERHLSDQQFNVNVLCEEMAISKSQLNRKMQAILNKGANAFIRSYRLERGKQLIESNTGTLAEISYDVGFSSPAYFSKCFHDEFGYTPKSLKK